MEINIRKAGLLNLLFLFCSITFPTIYIVGNVSYIVFTLHHIV